MAIGRVDDHYGRVDEHYGRGMMNAMERGYGRG